MGPEWGQDFQGWGALGLTCLPGLLDPPSISAISLLLLLKFTNTIHGDGAPVNPKGDEGCRIINSAGQNGTKPRAFTLSLWPLVLGVVTDRSRTNILEQERDFINWQQRPWEGKGLS